MQWNRFLYNGLLTFIVVVSFGCAGNKTNTRSTSDIPNLVTQNGSNKNFLETTENFVSCSTKSYHDLVSEAQVIDLSSIKDKLPKDKKVKAEKLEGLAESKFALVNNVWSSASSSSIKNKNPLNHFLKNDHFLKNESKISEWVKKIRKNSLRNLSLFHNENTGLEQGEFSLDKFQEILNKIPDLGNLYRTLSPFGAKDRVNWKDLSEEGKRFIRLFIAYSNAYFGDTSLEIKDGKLNAIPKTSKDMNTKSVNAGEEEITPMETFGFVDRNGNSYRFPGLSTRIPLAEWKKSATNRNFPTLRLPAVDIDSKRVASDLVRIFLEALFDSAFRLPAFNGATALKVHNRISDVYSIDNHVTGVFSKYTGKTRNAFIPKTSRTSSVDKEEKIMALINKEKEIVGYQLGKVKFSKIAAYALRIEGAVTSEVGTIVRGGGPLGVNNETLATIIATAAGVTAKKIAEHQFFCHFFSQKDDPYDEYIKRIFKDTKEITQNK